MTELSPKARDLFERVRREAAPTPDQKAALFSRLETRIAAPAGSGGWSWVVLGGSGFLVAALLAYLSVPNTVPNTVPNERSELAGATEPDVESLVATTPMTEPVREHEDPEAREPEPGSMDAPPASAVSPRSSSTEADSAIRVTRTRAPTPPAVTEQPLDANAEPPRDFAAELALMRSAQLARAQGHTEQALALLEEHRRDFQDGILAAERNVALAQIACERGDIERGRALGAPYRSGAFASRLAQSCGEER